MGSHQVPCSRSVRINYKLVERSAVSQVKSSIDLQANIFGVSYEVGVLQNKRLKNNLALRVLFLVYYAVNLHHNIQDVPFPGLAT